MIALHAELRVSPPHLTSVLATLRALLALAATEPGNLLYAVHRCDLETLVLYELYRDRTACDTHLASPAVVAALASFAEVLREPPRIRFAELLAAGGPLASGIQP